MNNNTRLRVRVPKALYESIQAQLAKKQINEADEQKASVQEIATAMDKAVVSAKKRAQEIADKKGGSLTQKDFFRVIDTFRSKIKNFAPFRMSTSQDNQSYVDNFMANAYPNPNMISPLGEAEEETQSSIVDAALMKSLDPAKKLVNSKITTPQQFAEFIKSFASEILGNESFADSLTKNANYSNAIKYLTQLSGDAKK
jgi:hypothetical protein